MNQNVYAKALYEVLQTGMEPERAFKNFMSTLKRRGALKALPKVLNELIRLTYREKGATPTLFVAREKDFDTAVKEIGVNDKKLTKKTDPTLIGGYRFENDGKLKDASYKSFLLGLFYKITNN